jgi:hypothetical protein
MNGLLGQAGFEVMGHEVGAHSNEGPRPESVELTRVSVVARDAGCDGVERRAAVPGGEVRHR